MSEDLGTEIKIGADASGVEAGVSKAKRSLASLGQAAELVGKSGGEGLLKIGAGGEASARNVEKATKSMIASIQRQTAATEAGGTSMRAYQETLARMRGIDSNVLKPYLDQLDAARNKADAAAKAQNGLGNSLGGLGTAASLARGAITGMLAGLSLGSMFAFVKNINDGVDGLNDLKDATGASIENLSALEDVALRTGTSIDTVGAALVKFNQVLGDAKPGSTQAAALKAIGLSAEELRRVDPAEALRQTAVALSQFADDGDKARLVQELFGKSVKEVMPFLNDLAEKTKLVGTVTDEQRAEAEKLNKQLFEMQKNMLDLSRTMVGPMVTSINEVIKKFKEGRAAGLGFMSIGWQNYKDNVSGFYSGMFGGAQPNTGGATGEWDAPEAPKPSVGSVPDPAAAKAAAGAAQKAAEAARREMGEQAKMMAELSGLSGTFAEDWARLTAVYKAGKLSLEQYTQAQADLLAKQPGIKAAADAEAKARDAALKASQLAADARNREADGIAAWLQAQEAAAAQALSGVQSRISGLQDEERAVALASGLNISLAEAIERVALARLEEKQAGFYEGSEGYLAIEREIAARKELTTLVAGRATREEASKAAREAEKEWKSSVEKYEDIFRQGFADMLNNGKDGWKSFTKSLATTFKTTVADQIYKMFAQPIVVKLVGSMLGLTGLSGAASAATGGSNLIGTALQGTSLYNGLTSGTGVLGSIGNAIGLGVGASTTMGGLGATAIGSYAAPSVAAMTIAPGATAAGAGGMSGALAAIPGWGWALAGVALLGGLARKFDDSGTPHIGAGAVYSEAGGLQEGAGIYNRGTFGMGATGEYAQGTQAGVSAIATGLAQTFDGIAKAFGKTAGYEIATAFADDSSKDGAWGSFRISQGGQDLLNWENDRQSKWAPREFANGEEGYKQYMAEIAKGARTALVSAIGDVSWAKDMLTAIGESASMEQLSSTVQQIAAIKTQFVQLGKAMEMFDGISSGMESALLSAAGSIDALTASAAGYYDAVYTEQEKIARSREQLESTLAGYGQSLPATREQYRALVEQQMAAGESGAEFAVVLMGLAGTFAQVSDDIEAQFAEIGKSASDVFEKLLADIGRVRGDVAGTRADMLASAQGMTPAQIAAAVNAAMVYAPNTAGVVSAQGGVASAASQVAISQAAYSAAQAVAQGAYGALQSAISGRDNVQSEIAARQQDIAGAQNTIERVEYGDLRGYRYHKRMTWLQEAHASIEAAQAQISALLPAMAAYAGAVADQQAAYDAAQNSAGAYAQQLAAAQAAVAAAQRAEVQARVDYAAQISQFVTAAGGSVSKLSGLREEVVRYYEAQEQAVQSMIDTAQTLRAVVDGIRLGQLDTSQTASQLGNSYASDYSMALATTGSTRAGYADSMASTLPTLAEAIKAEASTASDWRVQTGKLLAQATGVAGMLEADAAGSDYQTTSLGLLGSIDTALAQLEGSTKSAEQVIAQAINDGTASQLTGLRAIVAALRGESVPAFAMGGSFGGGLRLVGENGPELEVTGPSRIYSASQTAAMLSGGGNANAELVAELRALRADNQSQAAAMVNMQRELNKLMLRWDSQGMPEERIV